MDARRQFAVRLGQVLREHRLASGMLQEDVAEQLGVYQTFISKAELAERRIEVFDLIRLCELYGVAPGDVIAEAGEG